MNRCYYVAIIGAGPAGIAAAIQLQRSGITPLLFEQTNIGGLLNNAFFVENYPGFPKGISGINLVKKFTRHLDTWGINVVKNRVIKVYKNKKDFILQTSAKKYRVQILIVASGTKPKLSDIDLSGCNEKTLFEVYPIRNIKNKRIVIVGSGDAALDYALNLGRNNKITILNRNNKIKGLDLLFKRIKKISQSGNGKITFFKNTKTLALKQLNNYLIIKVLNKQKGETSICCDYVLFAIGREPAIDFLSSPLKRIFPDGDNKSIYFLGDVRQGNLRQTAIATGDGIKAAMKIAQVLKKNKEELHFVR
ncbi:NAD(P)/FAD-dependent oxidoreductase [candidate division WOR-3 bacterium]|nr:NAD(P)/FAD-dependent oxidoreductase [candidate division WOR-3 bacterium]